MSLNGVAAGYSPAVPKGFWELTVGVGEVLEGYDTLKKLATSPRHVVPGHDPLVLARYPAAKPGLEGWIARLDAEPKDA